MAPLRLVAEYEDMPPELRSHHHVLVIDDDVDLSTLLREYLEAEGFQISIQPNGRDGLAAALGNTYDAVILDIMLPQMNGMEVLQRLRRESQVPVIMLTAKGDNIDRVIGLECGADDYLAKPYYPRELVARLRAVLRRQPTVEAPRGTVLSFSALAVDTELRQGVIDGKPFALTASEFNILTVLLRAGDRTSAKDELSQKALGRVWEPYDRSIDVHISNLRQKLHALGDTVEIETVRGVGYRLKARR
jgi:two-component system OmpR family response regulator